MSAHGNESVERSMVPSVQSSGPPESGGSSHALGQLLASLRDLPLLTASEVTSLATQIRTEAGTFREKIARVPAASVLVLERWRERLEERRVTGLLAHRYRDEPSQSWSGFIDEKLGVLSGLVDVQAARAPAPSDAIATALGEAEILFEVLEEVARELGELTRQRDARTVARQRRLGLAAKPVRRSLDAALAALSRRNAARQTFASRNLRLVVHVAKSYRDRGVPLLDLIQEGSIGLLRAVDKFDPGLGYRFSTYAVWWIEQAVIRAIQRDSRSVRLPSHVYEAQLRLRTAESELRVQRGESGSVELAGALGIAESELERVASSMLRVSSLDARMDPDRDPLGERLADPDVVEPDIELDAERMREILNGCLGRLRRREREVLSWRFGLGPHEELTLQEVGARLGVSRERVRQIQNEALEKLRRQKRVAALQATLEK